MIKNFWFQWIVTTLIFLTGSIFLAIEWKSILAGITAYLVSSIIRDVIMLGWHYKFFDKNMPLR
jgi:riboflavin transporter FmnP